MKLSSLVSGLFTIAAGSVFAFAGGCAADSTTETENIGSAESALTEEQCSYFDINGTIQICHELGNGKFKILKLNEQACINAHGDHATDYVTSTDPSSSLYDPTCGGNGCLPEAAPCDETLPCCDGSACTDGICTEIDDCAAAPCQNGGTCVDGHMSYTCTCTGGYTGTNCEIAPDPCAAAPCQNGGTCNPNGADYTCTCAGGYTGTNCEIAPNYDCPCEVANPTAWAAALANVVTCGGGTSPIMRAGKDAAGVKIMEAGGDKCSIAGVIYLSSQPTTAIATCKAQINAACGI